MNLRYVGRRAATALAVLALAVTINFWLVRAAPGNYADYFVTTHNTNGPFSRSAFEAQRQKIQRDFGLNQPVTTQFTDYISQLAHGNLGASFVNGEPVTARLVSASEATLPLVLIGVVMGILIGIASAATATVYQGRWPDKAIVAIATTVASMPAQWVGILLLLVFAGILPLGGREDPFAVYSSPFAEQIDVLKHMILPSLTLGLLTFSGYTLIVRSAMLDVVGEDYVQVARARGFGIRWIVMHQILRNAALPTVSLIALSLGFVFGGTILVEVVFSWPGLGLLAEDSIVQRDYPVIQGTFLLLTLAIVAFNFFADVVAGWLDPRVAA
jgi:ABC-type dipeptide/oligopeptide/nickel transport system permease component